MNSISGFLRQVITVFAFSFIVCCFSGCASSTEGESKDTGPASDTGIEVPGADSFDAEPVKDVPDLDAGEGTDQIGPTPLYS